MKLFSEKSVVQLILSLWILLIPCSLFAQFNESGSDWIYKIPNIENSVKILTWKDGIIRIKSTDLNLSDDVKPDNLHLFYRGVEQKIYLNNTNNPEKFDQGDFFDFYSRRNDTEDEKYLYRHARGGYVYYDGIPNPHISNFTDTAAFFLVWNDIPRDKKFTLIDIETDPEVASNSDFTELQNFKFTAEFHADPSDPKIGATLSHGGGYRYDDYLDLNSDYTPGEGYIIGPFDYMKSIDLETPFPDPNSKNTAVFETLIHAYDPTPLHKVEIHLDKNFRKDVSFNASEIVRPQIALYQWEISTTGVTKLKIGTSPTIKKTSIAIGYAKLDYDRLFKFKNSVIQKIEMTSDAKNIFFQTEGFGSIKQDHNVFYYDFENNVRIKGSKPEKNIIFGLSKKSNESEGWLIDESLLTDSTQKFLVAKNLIQGYSSSISPFKGVKMIVLTHEKLRSSAEKYAIYRSENQVNSIPAKVVTCEEIYDEFGFGSQNVFAIKRFMRYALKNWEIKPEFLFLWGKGWYARKGNNLKVPTWGTPANDQEYVSNYDSAARNITPFIPVGRINAITDEDGFAYLEKLMEYEIAPYSNWMKRSLMAGGGQETFEQNDIFKTMSNWKNTFEKSKNAPDVYYFQKMNVNNGYKQPDISMKEVFDSGVSLFSFFGHSSATVFDVELLQPFEYNNFGKYPFIFANGCYAGQFNETFTVGEKYISEPKRGAIGYISSSSVGWMPEMTNFGNAFYEIICNDTSNSTIGKILQLTGKKFIEKSGLNQRIISQVQHNNLQGDPSLRLRLPKFPELTINPSSVTWSPKNVTTETEKIPLQFFINNEGAYCKDSFMVSIKLVYPDKITKWTFPPVFTGKLYNTDTLNTEIVMPKNLSPGIYGWEITVDSGSKIQEYDENNNEISIPLILPSGQVSILYPPEFSLINDSIPSIVAGFLNNFDADKQMEFEFELDTTPKFNSGYLKKIKINSSPANAIWNLSEPLISDKVYFLRVKSNESDLYKWANSSFTYRKGDRTGWSQSHPAQWQRNEIVGLVYDSLKKSWSFNEKKAVLRARSTPGMGVYQSNVATEFFLDGGFSNYGYYNMDFEYGVYYSIIDGESLRAITKSRLYGSTDLLAPAGMIKIFNVLESIKEGDYIFLLGKKPFFSKWKFNRDSLEEKLKSYGVLPFMNEIGDEDGFILVGKKGSKPGDAKQIHKKFVSKNDFLFLEDTLFSNEPVAEIFSTGIEKVSKWRTAELSWNTDTSERSDRIKYTINAQYKTEKDSTLFAFPGDKSVIDTSNNNKFLSVDLSKFNANSFTQLKLYMLLQDSTHRTSPQPKSWSVFFEPNKELALSRLIVNEKLVTQSDVIKASFNASNLTPFECENVTLKCRIINSKGYPVDSIIGYYDFAKNESKNITLSIPMKYPNDKYKIWFGLNDDKKISETTWLNNYLQTNVVVKSVFMLPILDVTFDGRSIYNYQIVSPSPKIQIRLTVPKNARKTVLNDTSTISLTIRNQESSIKEDLSYKNGWIKINSLESSDSTLDIICEPKKLADGIYDLSVIARPYPGEINGILYYNISFQVVNTGKISAIVAYPNPFSDEVNFKFQITGRFLPPDLKLEIFNAIGMKIKTIPIAGTRDGILGDVTTVITWNGTDQGGNPVTDGMYFYRFNYNNDKYELDKIDFLNKPPGFPDSGWGKLILKR